MQSVVMVNRIESTVDRVESMAHRFESLVTQNSIVTATSVIPMGVSGISSWLTFACSSKVNTFYCGEIFATPKNAFEKMQPIRRQHKNGTKIQNQGHLYRRL